MHLYYVYSALNARLPIWTLIHSVWGPDSPPTLSLPEAVCKYVLSGHCAKPSIFLLANGSRCNTPSCIKVTTSFASVRPAMADVARECHHHLVCCATPFWSELLSYTNTCCLTIVASTGYHTNTCCSTIMASTGYHTNSYCSCMVASTGSHTNPCY